MLKTINQKSITVDNNRIQKIKYNQKKLISEYISELSEFTGIEVEIDSLSSIEDMEKIRQKSFLLEKERKTTFTVDFDQRNSKRFNKFINSLYVYNNSPIYIWTDKSHNCGLFKIDSILKFNFSFRFNTNVEGIVVLLTNNLQDKLVLDYYKNLKEKRLLEIDVQGKN